MSLAIRNDRVFTEDSVIESGAVVVENRNISYYALPTSVSPDLTVASIPGHTLLPRHIVAHICTFDLSCENYFWHGKLCIFKRLNAFEVHLKVCITINILADNWR
jgi:hypothetical protein